MSTKRFRYPNDAKFKFSLKQRAVWARHSKTYDDDGAAEPLEIKEIIRRLEADLRTLKAMRPRGRRPDERESALKKALATWDKLGKSAAIAQLKGLIHATEDKTLSDARCGTLLTKARRRVNRGNI